MLDNLPHVLFPVVVIGLWMEVRAPFTRSRDLTKREIKIRVKLMAWREW